MKLFIQKGYHLQSLALPAKLIYTIFLVFIASGIWSSAAIYAARIGPDLEGPPGQPSVAERYVDEVAGAPEGDAAGGPALDLPEEEPVARAEVDTRWPWILDVFHQHLFTISVVFLILAHLFMLTRLHPLLTGVIVLLAGVSALLHTFAPVIIHLTGGWLWLMPVTGAAMGLSWTAMVLWTLVAMWLGAGARSAARA